MTRIKRIRTDYLVTMQKKKQTILNPFFLSLLFLWTISVPQIMSAQEQESAVTVALTKADSKIASSFKKLKATQLSDFYKVWSDVSMEYAATQHDTKCDSLVELVFEKYKNVVKKKPYLVLPSAITVEIYNREAEEKDISLLFSDFNGPDSTYIVIPHLNTDCKVLYDFEKTRQLLSSYLGKKDSDEKLPEIEKRMYIHHGHWGGWNTGSVPFIDFIIFFSNGVSIFVRTSWWSGEVIFIPKGTNEISIKNSWVE